MQILQIHLHFQGTQFLLYRNFIAEIHILAKKALGEETACLEMPIGDLNLSAFVNFHLIRNKKSTNGSIHTCHVKFLAVGQNEYLCLTVDVKGSRVLSLKGHVEDPLTVHHSRVLKNIMPLHLV